MTNTGHVLRATGATLISDGESVSRLRVSTSYLEATTHRLVGSHARLADMFVTDHGDESLLHLLWALDAEHAYVMTESPVAGDEYPPLSDIAPAAFIEECEVYEQFGLRPSGGKPLNRLAVPPHAGPDFPRLGRSPMTPPHEVHAPHSVGGHAFEFPYGPVRAAGLESLYLGLVTSGEEVVDLYLFTWHKHRGIEWRLRGMDPAEALPLVERVEGFSAVAHGWAFATAVEGILGVTLSPGALRTRAIALELERLYNHAAAVAALCQSTGLSVGQAAAEMALERLLRLNAAIFGHRYLFGVVDVGGVARRPDLDALDRELAPAHDEFRRVTQALSTTNSFLDRLEATGFVTHEQARRLGLVGPIARASGIDLDTRRDHPPVPYEEHSPRVPTRTAGDVLARFQTFLAEADESVRLLRELATGGVDRSTSSTAVRRGGSALGWAESPRGEALAWVELDAAGRIERARLRPAAVRNWRAFDDACRSQNVFTDVPIIEASFWLTVAGMAR